MIYTGDCLDILPTLEAESVDSIVTDPPYGLKFMGKDWDHGVPGVPFWEAALRVAKPGAFMLAFGGTRTFHRLAVAIEDAGWEIRDTVMWVYGSGFPKSLNVQQAINKAAAGHPQGGADPTSPNAGKFKGGCSEDNPSGRGFGAGAAAFMEEQGEARGGDEGQWEGWGTALKPAWEPILVCRKPIVGTVAANVLKYGTGAMNIDGCRVDGPEPHHNYGRTSGEKSFVGEGPVSVTPTSGRWPANLIHDGSDEVVALFPQSAGQQGDVRGTEPSHTGQNGIYGDFARTTANPKRNDSGSAARFFYCSKASRSERGEGNNHPTVKPLALMCYLCRLVTPPGGMILDPFMGSGSTGKAATLEGFQFIGIELEKEYAEIAEKRIDAVWLPLLEAL